ncbi:MAG: DUF58 domain-containing protein [Chloroflexota bacterium]
MHNLFIALIILFLTAVLLRMDWVYYLVYVVGGVWLFSHWWIRRSLDHLQVQRTSTHRAFAGEIVEAGVSFINTSWLPLPWLHVQEQIPLDLKDALDYQTVITVGSQSKSQYKYTLSCKKRGYYPIGPLVLRTGDLFGFTSTTWQENADVYMTVYPRVMTLEELGVSSRSPFGTLSTNQRLFEDPTRISGVRDYVSGDSMRRIHWKASAREDSLLVKKFQPAISLNVTIVLDLNRNAYQTQLQTSDSEWAIEVTASLANYVTEQRQPVGLLSNGRDPFSETIATPLLARNGQGQLMAILTVLARIQLHDFEQELEDWLPSKLVDLAWGTTLLVVTPKLTERTLWALHGAYRRGSSVTVLICSQFAEYELLKAQGERLGVRVERTVWERDLQRV